jgi:threonine dehydrogenase-like Zn-dependent dehydrogenase
MPLSQLMTADRFELRREKSRLFGATETIDPGDISSPHESNDADLTYEITGNPDTLNLAIELTGFDGRIVIGSWYGQKKSSIDLGSKFHRSRIRLLSSQVSTIAPHFTGRWNKARRMDVAWSMLANLQASDLITHRFLIADAARAYELLDQYPEQALQVLLTY